MTWTTMRLHQSISLVFQILFYLAFNLILFLSTTLSPRQPPVERPERRRVGADANETEARRLPAGGGTDEVPITRVRTGDSARRGVAVC